MDMREMVNKAKRGEPLYGKTNMSEYMQGMAARNSRRSRSKVISYSFRIACWCAAVPSRRDKTR